MTWADLTALAERLSLDGHCVTQIHHREQAAPAWEWYGVGALTYSGAEADCVVTADGVRHVLLDDLV